MEFKGKTSLVTGASQGIGETIALELSKDGAEVLMLDVQKGKVEGAAEKIRERGGKATAYYADVSNTEQISEVVKRMIQNHEQIHHVVNNAGITRDNLLMRMKEEEWDSVLAVNLKGVFNISQAVIRHMMGYRYGRIVNVSSVVGLMGNAGQANYSASKAGVIGFTKSLAREVASRGITVNAVAPGYIATAMTKNLPDAVKQKVEDIIPMKKFGLPEDVANAVRFLLSDKAAYITGQVLGINGGMLM